MPTRAALLALCCLCCIACGSSARTAVDDVRDGDVSSLDAASDGALGLGEATYGNGGAAGSNAAGAGGESDGSSGVGAGVLQEGGPPDARRPPNALDVAVADASGFDATDASGEKAAADAADGARACLLLSECPAAPPEEPCERAICNGQCGFAPRVNEACTIGLDHGTCNDQAQCITCSTIGERRCEPRRGECVAPGTWRDEPACPPRSICDQTANCQTALGVAVWGGATHGVSTGFAVGGGDFTWEMWLRADRAGHATGVQQTVASFLDVHIGILWRTLAEVPMVMASIDSGPVCEVGTAMSQPSVDLSQSRVFHHVAIQRRALNTSAFQLRIYLDGEAITTALTGVDASCPASCQTACVDGAGEVVIGGAFSSNDFAFSFGAMRYSRVARYGDAPFVPSHAWNIDADTVAQWLTTVGYDGIQVVDEAGGDNSLTPSDNTTFPVLGPP